MNQNILLSLLFISINVFSQSKIQDLESLNGIWIAEDYYNSFEKTNSAIKSKNAFYHNDPVALRINSSEYRNGLLNIGFSVLHDHLLHPEVSEFILKDTDTIREQGSFKINLKSKDSLGYYKTTEIGYFNYDWVSYLTWNSIKETIILYRPERGEIKELKIKFVKIKSSFETNYKFPNPLYYYTRSKNLTGSYTLKDSKGKVISNDLAICENGLVKGFSLLENYTAYFSTDVYCGLPANEDIVIFNEDVLNNESNGYVYSFVKNEEGNIELYENEIGENNGIEVIMLANKVYELIKNDN